MQDFSLYFELGWQHILDWQGYDHIIFVAALCGVYLLEDWRRVIMLVTAFTIGHSVTLALSVFNQIKVSTSLTEFLIPVTIVVTSIYNIISKNQRDTNIRFKYIMALFFGLIHGMGFSSYLKSLLGKDTSIVGQLFAFNIGLEFGQIIIVLSVLIVAYLVINVGRTALREWNLFLSSAIFGIAFVMTLERFSSFIH